MAKSKEYMTLYRRRGGPVLTRPDIAIRKGIGAAFYFDTVKDIDGSIVEMEIGTTVTDIEVIAGVGVERQIDDYPRLHRKYGGGRDEWQKVKGFGKIIKDDIEIDVELHWYELIDGGGVPYDRKIAKYLL